MGPICQHVDNVVVGALPCAAGCRRELVQVAVQLQDELAHHACAERTRIHGGQRVSVAGDLLLRPVHRSGPLRGELGHSAGGGGHALYAAGRLDALNTGDLTKRAQELRRLTLEELLLALVLAEQPDRADRRHRNGHLLETSRSVRASHQAS